MGGEEDSDEDDSDEYSDFPSSSLRQCNTPCCICFVVIGVCFQSGIVWL